MSVVTQPVNRIAETNGVALRKVAIIGKAPSSVHLAPYDKDDWEIWILNTLGHLKEVPRWDRQYELHDLELTKDPAYGSYHQWLSEQTKPVYTRDGDPGYFKGALKYPLAEMLERFPYSGKRYLTNTVSLMVAHAIYEHLEGNPIGELGIWGVDMAQQGSEWGGNAGMFNSEYAKQRPSVEYWIGIAEGLGLTVTVPETSDILKTACIYGYHTTDRAKKFAARRQELQQRIGSAQQVERQKHDEAVFLSGALEGMNYDTQWLGG